jgi:antitoxin VapB
MGLDIKNSEVENLAGEVAALMGVTKTEAVRQALEEKKRQVIKTDRRTKLKNLLVQKIWPSIPKEQLGKCLTRKEENQILGYGEDDSLNYLKAAFWDYPQFTDEAMLRSCLVERKNTSFYFWLMVRFLEYARVLDTLKFFAIDEIAGQLSELKLRPYTRKKWKRMVEVYGTSSGK